MYIINSRIKRLVLLGTRMLQIVYCVFYLHSFLSGSVTFFEFDLRIYPYFYILMIILFWFFFVLFCFLDDFLNELLWTGVRDTKLPNRTYLIASIKSKDGEDIFNKRFKNEPSLKHAEAVMLCDDDFGDAVAVHHDIEITLTLNYSPCSDCANELKKFYEKNRNIRNPIIQFSFLYRIEEEKNQHGLRNLREAGITLQAMNANSWREVGVNLESMASSDVDRITERDEDTEGMLNKVLFTYESEQDQDTSNDDELSSLFQSQLKFL